jgi:hypothetical protein
MFSSTVRRSFVTDFVNLKIKSTQSFGCAHRGRLYVCVYMSECSYVYKYLYLYYVSQKIILVL